MRRLNLLQHSALSYDIRLYWAHWCGYCDFSFKADSVQSNRAFLLGPFCEAWIVILASRAAGAPAAFS